MTKKIIYKDYEDFLHHRLKNPKLALIDAIGLQVQLSYKQ